MKRQSMMIAWHCQWIVLNLACSTDWISTFKIKICLCIEALWWCTWCLLYTWNLLNTSCYNYLNSMCIEWVLCRVWLPIYQLNVAAVILFFAKSVAICSTCLCNVAVLYVVVCTFMHIICVRLGLYFENCTYILKILQIDSCLQLILVVIL